MPRQRENFLGFQQHDIPHNVSQWSLSEAEYHHLEETAESSSGVERSDSFSLSATTETHDFQQPSYGDHFNITDPYFTSPISPTTGNAAASRSTGSPASSGPTFGILNPSASSSNDIGGGEDIMSSAIEEDKRRRNTAASARFRLKKKEREADLERRARDMSDRCEELQKRIGALETENRWLRELITERSRNRGKKGVRAREVERRKKIDD
jgi:Basic region leucine zipper